MWAIHWIAAIVRHSGTPSFRNSSSIWPNPIFFRWYVNYYYDIRLCAYFSSDSVISVESCAYSAFMKISIMTSGVTPSANNCGIACFSISWVPSLPWIFYLVLLTCSNLLLRLSDTEEASVRLLYSYISQIAGFWKASAASVWRVCSIFMYLDSKRREIN